MWSEMNCPLNKTLLSSNGIYLSETGPPDPVGVQGIRCQIYEGEVTTVPESIESDVINFIKIHNRTGTGNITELEVETFRRLRSMPGALGILWEDNLIVGTMFSLSFHSNYKNTKLDTSYTTFLCIHNKYRKQALAMILIRSIMKFGYDHYGLNHGYYMTLTPHHELRNSIASWYRPINLKALAEAHFSLATFIKPNDRTQTLRQKLWYHISTPNVLPRKATLHDDLTIQSILRRGTWHLEQSSADLLNGFDIYLVNNNLFILFPMTSVIASSGKRIKSLVVVLMIGNVLAEALWLAKERKVHLLYGWCGGDITSEAVNKVRGHLTVSETFLEFYNSRESVPNNEIMMPIF
jgi:hypothetical protein